MANTNFVSFPLYRNYTGTGGVGEDCIGDFSCRIATAEFLDILTLAGTLQAAVIRKRKKSKARDLTLIDGKTKLKTSKKEGGTPEDGTAKEADVLGNISRKGTRSVQLIAGKKTPNNNYKRLTFRFPGFATNLIIADALGSILPASKVKANPTDADVFNVFISPGGRRYPILTKAAADKEKSSTTPTTRGAAMEMVALIEDARALEAEG